MQITYIAHLSNAWNRMLKSLFKPFDIKKWFVLGFTAFLAHLLEWKGGSSGENNSGHFNFGDFLKLPQDAMDWMNKNPDWATLIIIGIVLIVGIIILCIWLSSRGKFMFLDNVIHNRALVKKPWAEYHDVAHSLFLWRLGFGLVAFFILGSYFSYIYLQISDMYTAYASDREMIFAAIRMGIFFIILAIAVAYISLFLNDFIVPLMYKHNTSVWIAWSHFMPLFTKHFIYFILYGILVLFLHIIIFIIIMILGFMTCCIGFIFLVIPYISSVVLLPISMIFRAFSVEFLEQFDPQNKYFPEDSEGLETAG